MGLFTKVFGTYSQRELKSIYPIVDKITALEDEYRQLTDAELQAKTPEFKERLAAVYAIILSFSPKFDALVNSIPSAIVGGVSFILYGMISAVGVRNIVENQVDLTKSRNLIIAAVMFVSGLGFSSVGGVSFTVGGAAVTLSGLAIAALCGVILNAILPGNDYEFGISVEGDKSADLGSY